MPATRARAARYSSIRACRIGALLITAAGSMVFARGAQARDLALVDLQGEPVSLDAYREDGRWTLFMIRHHGCGPCDRGERELRQWFSAQDGDEVSVLVLNLDDGDTWASTRERLDRGRIGHPNTFTLDREALSASYRDIT